MTVYESREDTSVQRGTLFFWLSALHPTEWPVLRDGYVMEDMIRGQAAIREAHLSQYEALLGELHNQPVSVRKTLDVMLTDSRTIIMCAWRVGTLLSTVQASLTFQGGAPTVLISDMVTTETERGQGNGRMIMEDLMREAEVRWYPVHGRLTFTLTSRPERGTAAFYERLGFRGTPTTRYVK